MHLGTPLKFRNPRRNWSPPSEEPRLYARRRICADVVHTAAETQAAAPMHGVDGGGERLCKVWRAVESGLIVDQRAGRELEPAFAPDQHLSLIHI